MNDSFLAQEYLKELDAETPATQKCLERITPELFGWKPHPKSMEMGYLTLLVAEMPLWIAHIAQDEEIDFATFKHIEARTTQQVLDHFQDNLQQAHAALQNITDGGMDAPFYLKANRQTIFTSTRREQLSSTLNHWVHHRGQLTVYMRLNDIAVPSIYGPSADDRSFG
ncbi:DinB family protein [Mucilaginibacter terrae]|uniref:DinB family protein n=1 Tax=Mucilaginibacter terrae TaxID=1955052 RepID=UPI00367309DE